MSHRRRPRQQVQRPRQQIEELLRRHYRLMKRAGEAFDAGSPDEALHLALGIRVMVHDGQGRSLLSQLGLRKRLRFVDTSLAPPPPPAVLLWPRGLVIVRSDFDAGRSQFMAPLDDLSPERVRPGVRFSEWWGDPVIEASGQLRTRRDFVLPMANSEGAHVDPEIAADYDALLRETHGFTFGQPDGTDAPPDERAVADATVRQIAHELLRTLERDWRTAAILGVGA